MALRHFYQQGMNCANMEILKEPNEQPGRCQLSAHRVVFPAPEAPCNSAFKMCAACDQCCFRIVDKCRANCQRNTARATLLVQSLPSGL